MSDEELHSIYVVLYETITTWKNMKKLCCLLYPLLSWPTLINFFYFIWLFSKHLLLVKLHVVVLHRFVLNQAFCQQPWHGYTYNPVILSLGFQTLTNVFPTRGWFGRTLSFKSTCFFKLLSYFMFELFQHLKSKPCGLGGWFDWLLCHMPVFLMSILTPHSLSSTFSYC